MGKEYFIQQLNLLQQETKKKSKESSALKLYHSQARGILFKLQALCRIYKRIHNKDLFKALQDEFKLTEDALGQIDYYDNILQQFAKRKDVTEVTAYFKNQMQHAIQQLTLILNDVKVMGVAYSMSVTARLENAEWIADSYKERTAIAQTVIDAIDKLQDDYKKGKLNFANIEEGLHEFRRKLRWISIYMSATDGLFQLKKVTHTNEELVMYQTPEIINLPYNILPKAKKGVKVIYIESQNFYALSWLIQELGKLKDTGLTYMALNEALKNDSALKQKLQKELEITPKEITSIAQNMTDDFVFKHGILARIKRDIYRSIN